MVKVIISLRDKDLSGNKLDNTKDIFSIINYTNKYFNVKNINVRDEIIEDRIIKEVD